MLDSRNPLDDLFEKQLSWLSNRQLRNWAFKHGLEMDRIYAHRWRDETGHAWSFLSRVGYFHARRSPERTGSSLLEMALSQGIWGNPLAVQTQPGEPDLLWAWLGSLSFAPNSNSRRLDELLQKTLGCLPSFDSEDGQVKGWVSQALAFGKAISQRWETKPHMHAWIDCLAQQNLLCPARNQAGLLGINVPFPGWSSWNDWGDASRGSRDTRTLPRDEKVWAALMDWATVMVERDPALSVKTKFSVGYEVLRPTVKIGAEGLAALQRYVQAGALDRLEQPIHGGTVNATALLFLNGVRFSPSAEKVLVSRLLDPTFDRDPGEPEGSLFDWHGLRKNAALDTWVRGVQLDAQLPGPARRLQKPRF